MIHDELPQLIVALDSLDDKANYIHIKDAKKINYYCPCCKEIVKPRAYDENQEYCVQPHFYHLKGACDLKKRTNWMLENWFLRPGATICIGDDTVSITSVVLHDEYHTQFGIYTPDITIETDEKFIFVEIDFDKKQKRSDFFCKWQELDVDVIRIDTKQMLLQDYNSEPLQFSYLFHNGECLCKEYIKKDLYASTIGQRKLEWKRQDKLNYKIFWERLDWFWNVVSEYKTGAKTGNDLCNSFKQLDYLDMISCMTILKKMNCQSNIKQMFEEECKVKMKDYIEKLECQFRLILGNDFHISYHKIGERTAYIVFKFINTEYISINENDEIRISKNKGFITPEVIEEINAVVNNFKTLLEQSEKLKAFEQELSLLFHDSRIYFNSIDAKKVYGYIENGKFYRPLTFKLEIDNLTDYIRQIISKLRDELIQQNKKEDLYELLNQPDLKLRINELNNVLKDKSLRLSFDYNRMEILLLMQKNLYCSFEYKSDCVIANYDISDLQKETILSYFSNIEENIDDYYLFSCKEKFDVIKEYQDILSSAQSDIWNMQVTVTNRLIFIDVSLDTFIKRYYGKRIILNKITNKNAFEIKQELREKLTVVMNDLIRDANKSLLNHGAQIVYLRKDGENGTA